MTEGLNLTYSFKHKNLYVSDKRIAHHVEKDIQKIIEKQYFSGIFGLLKRLISSIIDVKWRVELSDEYSDLINKINAVATRTILNNQQQPVVEDPVNTEWESMFRGRKKLHLKLENDTTVEVAEIGFANNSFTNTIWQIASKTTNSKNAATIISKYMRYWSGNKPYHPDITYIDVVNGLTQIHTPDAIAILLELKKSDPIFQANLTSIVTNLNAIADQKKETIRRGMQQCMENGINCTLSRHQINELVRLTDKLSQLWRTCLLTKSLLQDGQPELLQRIKDNISFVTWHCFDGLSLCGAVVFSDDNETKLKRLALEILREKPSSLCTTNGLKIQTWLYSSKISELIETYNDSCDDGDLRAYHSIKTGTKYQRFWNSELQLKRWINLLKKYSKPEKYNEKIFGELCTDCDTFITNIAQNDRNTVIQYLKNNMALLNYLPQSSVIHDVIFEANREAFSISHTQKNKRVSGKTCNNTSFNRDISRPSIYIGPPVNDEADALDMEATYSKDALSQQQQQMDYLSRLKQQYLGEGNFGYSFYTSGHGIDDYGGGFDYFWNVISQGLGDPRVLSEIFGNLISIQDNKLVINDPGDQISSDIWRHNCQFLAYVLKQCIGQGITLPFEVDWHRLIFTSEEVFQSIDIDGHTTYLERETITHNFSTIRQTNSHFREMYNLIEFHELKDHLKKQLIVYGLFDREEQEELTPAIMDYLDVKKRLANDSKLRAMQETLNAIPMKQMTERRHCLQAINAFRETWKQSNNFYEKERYFNEITNKRMANITDDKLREFTTEDIIKAAIGCPEEVLDLIDDDIFHLVSQEAGPIIDDYTPNRSEQTIACELIWSSKNRSLNPVFGQENTITGPVGSSFSCYDLPNAASLITLAKKATERIDYTHLLDKLIVNSPGQPNPTLNNELFSYQQIEQVYVDQTDGSIVTQKKGLNTINGLYYDYGKVDDHLAYLLNTMREEPQLIKSFLETVSSKGQIPVNGIKIKQTKATNPLPTDRTSTSNYGNRYDLTHSPMMTSTCFSEIHLPPPRLERVMS